MITCIEDQIARDENYSRFPYTDSVGKLTIAFGRNLTDKGVRDDEGLLMRTNDLNEVTDGFDHNIPWWRHLDIVRQGVLINMGFNMGVAGVLAFHTFLGLMRAGDYDNAANDLQTTKWFGQVGSRAYRLMQQVRTGQWQ